MTKGKKLISVLILISVFCVFSLVALQESKNITTINKPPAPVDSEALEPSTEEMNSYIQDQIEELGIEGGEYLEERQQVIAKLNELKREAIEAGQLDRADEVDITQPNHQVDLKLAKEEFAKSDIESKAQLIERLSKQTGLSSSELQQLFYGEFKDSSPAVEIKTPDVDKDAPQ